VEKANLSANHGASRIAVLFSDGHAETQTVGSWADEATSWGGPLLFAASLKRLEARHPVLKQIKSASPKAFVGQKAKLRAGLDELRVLAGQSQSSGIQYEVLNKRLWKGAGVLRALGEGKLEQELTADLNRQVQSLLQETGGQWQSLAEFEEDEAHPFTLRFPRNWRVQTESDGRYRTTYLHSASPYLEALVERGERNRPTDARTIDWSGMEAGLKKKYGAGYKRLKMGRSTLNGQDVSLWECELKKPDGPRLHKRYLGHSSRWNSTILVTMAPVGQWKGWSPVFERMTDSFEFRE
jgi:hypothetical protein